jgi:hypothetical protein
MDVDKLLRALDDDTNDTLMNFNSKKIKQMNLEVISELILSKSENKTIMDKLSGYKYIDEINDLRYGTYIRWINIEDPKNICLNKGALFCNIEITNDGIILICKNFGYKNKHFRLNMDSNLIFQKLTEQENILILALDHISKC